MLAWLVAVAALAQDPECFPACRDGYLCHLGQCISACNPACGEGERCTSAGECVAAVAPAPASPAPVPQALPTGRICVFRDRTVVGAAIRVTIMEGEQPITSLNPGRFHCWDTSAGMHTLNASTEVMKTWDVSVTAGETTWLQASIVMGMAVGRPELRPATQADFELPKRPYEEANALR